MNEKAAAKTFQSYLDNAMSKSGKSVSEMHGVLRTSGLTKHADLRAFAMREFGLGHGHAQAVVMRYLKPDFRRLPKTGSPRKPAAKK